MQQQSRVARRDLQIESSVTPLPSKHGRPSMKAVERPSPVPAESLLKEAGNDELKAIYINNFLKAVTGHFEYRELER